MDINFDKVNIVNIKSSKVKIKEKEYEVIKTPHPHILVTSKKNLHGWWPGKRECTSERLLINPYNGCFFGCFFCYSYAFWGYFDLFYRKKIITVFNDYHKEVSKQLDSVNFATCGYLSPVTDPFQPLENKYRLSEKIVYEFVRRNIPIEFITKSVIPDSVIELIKRQKHSFGQVSVLTLNQALYKRIIPRGVPLSKLLDNFARLSKNGIFSVCRIDPILPYITDDLEDIYRLIKRVKNLGVTHIVVSCLDIPFKLKNSIIEFIGSLNSKLRAKYIDLYTDKISNGLHADIEYRTNLFKSIREICNCLGVTFALCMEFRKVRDRNEAKDKDTKYKNKDRNEHNSRHYARSESSDEDKDKDKGKSKVTINMAMIEGLNKYFMTSYNCEGIDIPVYKRVLSAGESANKSPAEAGWFEPMEECLATGKGNCLNCKEKACGIKPLISINASQNPGIDICSYR